MAHSPAEPLRTNGQPKSPITAKTIVFIHGAFVSYECWQSWKAYFEARGYECIVLPWPGREQPAAAQRAAHPDPERGRQTLAEVIEFLAYAIGRLPTRPILIGHSLGGLLVQLLLNRGLGAAGVAIHSAPPRGVISFKWSFIKASWPLLNPFIPASRPFLFSFTQWQYAFTNGLPLAEQQASYNALVIPESRRLARAVLGKRGAVDYTRTTAPLLLTSGGQDQILPWGLHRQNFRRYRGSPAHVAYQEFPDRTHSVLGQQGWENVAAAVHGWLQN
jgi:pimeloyl-ACP methyl ester carboxylesterase